MLKTTINAKPQLTFGGNTVRAETELKVRVSFKNGDDGIEVHEMQADGSQVVTFDNRMVLLIEDGRYCEDLFSDADLFALVVNNYLAAQQMVFADALEAAAEKVRQDKENACVEAA